MDFLGDAVKQFQTEKAPPKPFKLLPGDPYKGTLYKGFISKIEPKKVAGEGAVNQGETMLVVHLQVSEGEYKGNEEIVNRVLTPKMYNAEPTTDEDIKYWKDVVLKENRNLPESQLKAAAIKAWQESGRKYYRKTIEQFASMGAEIKSGDIETLVAEVANCVGNAVAWKIYDAIGNKPRRVYFENRELHFPAKETKEPLLYQSLPSGSDIPI